MIMREICGDVISRKKVFETFGELLGQWGRKALMEIPSVAPTQKWIPISEGLPKVTDRYYVTFETYSGGYMVREMFYRKPENYWTDINDILSNDEIIAWMPIRMPEPYKKEEVEE